MEIILLRHGKPDFSLSGYIKANQLNQIAKSYENSRVKISAPAAVIKQISKQHKVVCSHLPRSITSAKLLGCKDIYLVEEVFAETSIPYFNQGKIKLPVKAWIIILRLIWLCGFSQNGESFKAMKIRAKKAADRLHQIAKRHGKVLLVGHGMANYFIAGIKIIRLERPRFTREKILGIWCVSIQITVIHSHFLQ